MIPCMEPLTTLITADLATLKISNQKNGKMGQTITQHSTGSYLCPIKALAHIVHYILSEGGTNDTLLCSVGDKESWTLVEPCHIIDAVRGTEKELKLDHRQLTLILWVHIHYVQEGPWP